MAALIRAEDLVSRELFNFSKKLLEGDKVLDIYLHKDGGPITIGGGSFGEQTIVTLPIPQADQSFIAQVVEQLDARLDIDFRWVDTPGLGDVRLYYDTEIKIDGAAQTLGLAIPNSSSSSSQLGWWEVILNTPEFTGDQAYLRYALIHELGHTFGLEHPFDGSDGDLVNGIRDPWRSAFPEDTVMAYRSPSQGIWPQLYTENDWIALESLWGVETTPQNWAPLQIGVSPNRLPENLPASTTRFKLTTNDPNANDSHSYALVNGEGDSDNHRFSLQGDELQLEEQADYEHKPKYSIRVRSTDSGGLSVDQILLIDVEDLDEQPPAKPTLQLASEDDTGESSVDGLTAVNQPRLEGSAEAGATVVVVDVNGNRELGRTMATANGRWQLQPTGSLQEGQTGAVAIAIDAAQNQSLPSEPLWLTIDTSPPAVQASLVEASASALQTIQLTANETVTWTLMESADRERFSLDRQGLLTLLDDRLMLGEPSDLQITVSANDLCGNQTELHLTIQIEPSILDLPPSLQGTALLFSEQSMRIRGIRSLGAPDAINVDTATNAYLQLSAADIWSGDYLARNVGSPGHRGTGEGLALQGLGRYAVVIRSIPEASTTIELDQSKDSAFFLHDAYSGFHSSVESQLQQDYQQQRSAPRLSNIDTIIMGGAHGTSLVDLSSANYACPGIMVLGGTTAGGLSVFWGGAGDDSFQARGADTLIFGGAGTNSYVLSAGKDTLQLVQGGQCRDRIPRATWTVDGDGGGSAGPESLALGFEPNRDCIQLWRDHRVTEPSSMPTVIHQGDSSVLVWGDNQITFEGVSLTLDQLNLVERTTNQAGMAGLTW